MKRQHYLLFAAMLLLSFAPEKEIAYPEGYRDWTHVKTYIVGPKNPAFKFIGGFNHVYANDLAVKGYQTGEFPDGSVIVSDVVTTVEDSITIREGNRHHIDVMVKGKGGWDFQTFLGDSRTERMLTIETAAKCLSCHKKDKNMVFSEYRK